MSSNSCLTDFKNFKDLSKLNFSTLSLTGRQRYECTVHQLLRSAVEVERVYYLSVTAFSIIALLYLLQLGLTHLTLNSVEGSSL